MRVERQVQTGRLHTVPVVHDFFSRHQLEWMARCVGSYSEEIVREFYTSYVVTLRGALDRWSNPAKHDPLTDV